MFQPKPGEDPMVMLNRWAAQELGLRGTTQANYRYFSDRRTKDMYFWTTEKITWKGKPRYISGIYRYHKTKKEWEVPQSTKAGHATRSKAKARALKMYQGQI